MALGTNILLFMIILNVVMIILGVASPTEMLLANFISIDKTTNRVQVAPNLVAMIFAIATTASIIASALGLLPNINLGVLMLFLVSFATFPISIFNSTSISFEFKLLFGGVIAVLYLLALISFARGGEL